MTRLAVAALLAASVPASAATPFDGRWSVVLSCPAANDGAKGYTFRFDAAVRDGVLHGQNSSEGMAGFLVLDGSIRPDGTADLTAHGETGNPDYVVGRASRATPYGYTVQARFTGDTGSGQRTTVRACNFAFGRYR